MKNAAEERKWNRQGRRRKTGAVLSVLLILLTAICLNACGGRDDSGKKEGDGTEDVPVTSGESYGVFLGIDERTFRIEDFEGYDLVVIDAQELRKEQLKQLHSTGHTVYSYLNVGSLEKSRDYYREFKSVCLDRYDNWPDEYWVDVTDEDWIKFTSEILPETILELDPNIDGLFLDNLDVYAHLCDKKKYEDIAENAFDALVDILEAYKEADLPVLVNGADEFVTKLIEEDDQGLIRGVNQETVFTKIKNYDKDRFGRAGEKEKKYYISYLKKCSRAGLDVFVLEYTKDKELAEEIAEYCSKMGYRYYISEHVNLNPSD